MLIINNEVPTAVLKGSPVKKTKAGIIKNPPPAPTSPVKNPMMSPSSITRKVLNFSLVEIGFFFPRIIGIAASTINTAKIPNSKSRFVKTKLPDVKSISGIDGTIQCRVQKILMIEGIPNNIPVRIFTKCWRYFGIAPTRLVTPTINNEYAEARTGSI